MYREREQGVSVRGGTRPTHSVSGVAAAASISRRVAALPVPTQLLARGHVSPPSLFNIFLYVLGLFLCHFKDLASFYFCIVFVFWGVMMSMCN
jgi:hypothetical protein